MVRRVIFIILLVCYLAATIVKSDIFGNLLSPIITLHIFITVFIAFYYKNRNTNRYAHKVGLILSLGILSWAVADILWAYDSIVLHIDPMNSTVIEIFYALTNFLIALSLTVYGLNALRKWNIMQILLDSTVTVYFVLELTWIVFLNENSKNIIMLKTDWISAACIILDILIAVWIMIWYMSNRNGTQPLYMTFITLGILLFALTDLVYYYQYFYSTYESNSIIDAIYICAFSLLSISAMLRLKSNYEEIDYNLFNTGHSFRGYALLLAPILIVIFKGFVASQLFQFAIVILIYFIMSNQIQNCIYKHRQLLKEKEHRSELEEKVRSRTEELEEKNRVLQNLLDQDFVTGLKNRRYLLAKLEKTIKSLKEDETIVLLYIDINRFKMISTMYGHFIGDMIIYEMAERLRPLEKMVKHTILTSYGDDTFVFAAIGKYTDQHGLDFAQEAIKLCSDIYRIEEYQIRITVNIGISIYPKDSQTKEELIRHADIAMSQARHQGFNYVREYDVNLSQTIFRKNTIEIMLKKVNFNQEFMVYYQPQFETQNKKLIGFEALLRWRTVSGEMIGPGEFIPVAEETGYILPIGDWVMDMAMKQLIMWNKRNHDKIMIGINVSLKQLNAPDFMSRLVEEIDKYKIIPEWIDLEITESLQLHVYPEILTLLKEIRKLGIKVSIDDFGTGYSSLSYFKNLEVDRIKLAKELIDNVHRDDFDYKLVEAIILLSKAKGIRVIAEGVETLEQWEVLKELQCDEVQGYYFGRPEPVDEIETKYFATEQPENA